MVQGNAKCVVCGKSFTAKRATAKYDSAACRQTAKRDIGQLWGRVLDIERMLYEIQRTQSDQVPAALKRIGETLIYVINSRKA